MIRYAERVVFSTDDSGVPVHITYPSPLNDHEIADLEQFLAIWIKSQKRRYAETQKEPAPTFKSLTEQPR